MQIISQEWMTAIQKILKNLLQVEKQERLKKLLEYAGEDRIIDDPWYTGDFKTTFNDVTKDVRLYQIKSRKIIFNRVKQDMY